MLLVNAFRDSEILNTVVRMVVPMQREFGRHLDVSQFLRDQGYAQEVLDEAMRSGDSRLRDYATYVQARLSGARMAADPPAPAAVKLAYRSAGCSFFASDPSCRT